MVDERTVTSFAAGAGVGIVLPSTYAVLEPMASSLAERLWERLDGDASLDGILEALSASGLRTLGSFALAESDGQRLRVVVRGAGRAVAWLPSGERITTAGEVRTWVEEVIEGYVGFELSIDDPASPSARAPARRAFAFRVVEGLVPATALRRTVDSRTDLSASSFSNSADIARSVVASPIDDPRDESTAASGGITTEEIDDGRTRIVEDESLVAFRSAPTLTASPTPAASSSPPVSSADAEGADEYDAIYGRTVARSVQAAAVRAVTDDDESTSAPASESPRPAAPVYVTPSAPPMQPEFGSGLISGVPGAPRASGAAATVPVAGDHDGRTMTSAQLAALRSGRPTDARAPVAAAGTGGMMVHAIVCASGHANPPQLSTCRYCGLRMEGAPNMVPRPALGVLRFSNGFVLALDRPAIIGRNPKLEGVIAGEVPTIVKLDVGQGLSRNHAAVRLEGWTVLLDDLNSANGTVVRLPGREPQRLRPGEPMLLEPGAVIDFGGELTCQMYAD